MSTVIYFIECLSSLQGSYLSHSVLPRLPSTPDQKQPLPRCFMMHYGTVAMATLSEGAAHTTEWEMTGSIFYVSM